MNNGRHFAKGSALPTFPDDGKLRLFSMRFCPFAHRIHLVLDAKKIPHHVAFINLQDKPEWLTQKSPLGKVPALELPSEKGGLTLYESLIVAEYLDEKYPQTPLFPKNPLEKALDKLLIERFNSVIGPMYRVFTAAAGSESAPGAITEILTGLDVYEAELDKRSTPFFGGQKPGMLDYMIWPWCERADMLKYLIGDQYALDDERFPKLLQWRGLMQSDPAVKTTFLSGETHAKFMETRRNGVADYDMLATA